MDIKELISKYKISQVYFCRLTKEIFKEQIINEYKLLPYKNKNKPVIFIGCNYNSDRLLIKNHKSIGIVLWFNEQLNGKKSKSAKNKIFLEEIKNKSNLNNYLITDPTTLQIKSLYENIIEPVEINENQKINIENLTEFKHTDQEYLYDFSIVMAYYNRKEQTLETLKGFEKLYAGKYNFEVIIVDDNSNQENKLNNIINNFTYTINLIEISKEEKGIRSSPIRVFNKGFDNTRSKTIIIQNPECIHIGDILNYVNINMEYDKYISFPCYNSNNYDVNKYIYDNYDKININNIDNLVGEFNEDEKVKNFPRWYQHPTIHNKNFHFCVAISKEYLDILGGFDNLYDDGHCFDDDDLVYKIKEILKLDIDSVTLDNNIGVIHLFHGRSAAVNISGNNDPKINSIFIKYKLNENRFVTIKEHNNIISCPKLFHYYWDDFTKFSYMNLYSLKSSVYYHPDYIHIIWVPINPEKNISWLEFCNKDFNQDKSYKKYIDEIKKINNVRVIYKDITKFIGVNENMSEIHKSDLFRYKIIHRYGGIWSDLDIVYIKSITDIINYDFDTINFLCNNKENRLLYIPIGLLLSKRKSALFQKIFEEALDNYDSTRYQCLGSELLLKIFFRTTGKENAVFLKDYIDEKTNSFDNNKVDIKISENRLIYNSSSGAKNILLDENIYMSLNWSKIEELFIDNIENNNKDINVVGYHWFNGSDKTKEYLIDIQNNYIPKKFNGSIFIEKNKFCNYFDIIKYFDFEIDSWAKFYKNKLNNYINIFKKYKKYENIPVGKYGKNNFSYRIKPIYNELYLIDELTYNDMLFGYIKNKKTRQNIINFLNSGKYIVFFCELFFNENLQTIGNGIHSKEFATLLLKKAKKIFICNTKNINYLVKKNIIHNITYFPPLGYSEINNFIPLEINNKQNIDILFYGNINGSFTYRNNLLNKIKIFSKSKNYNFICKNNLYDEKDNYLKNSKIVLHTPSYENLETFPWAKVVELMCKKIFFIIEENEEMYAQGLEQTIIFYKRNNINDLKEKIKTYINNKELRNQIIEKNFNFIQKKYNLDLLIRNICEYKF